MSNSKNWARGLALASMVSSLLASSSSYAQLAPGASRTAPAASQDTDPQFVVLSDLVAPCADPSKYCPTPRAARPSTLAGDSPIVTKAVFLAKYPQMGVNGDRTIANSKSQLCDNMNQHLAGISSLDQLFMLSDNEYNVLTDVYNQLPDDVKRATAVMTVAQAVQTGALCILSAGLYCIAAASGAIGNVFVSQASKKLQLANIRLSIANIVVTRLNIWSNRLTLRLDADWIQWYAPACQKLGYTLVSDLPPLPRLPEIPAGFGRR